MKERPIIFSDVMVRAILEGKKTQTRRVIKFERLSGVRSGRLFYSKTFDSWAIEGGETDLTLVKCPHGRPGDRLWVRETWAESGYQRVEYRAHPADGECFRCVNRWRSPLHMPRWASRITLEITDVRVERLNNISELDCEAELGTAPHSLGDDAYPQFRSLWDSIHGPGAWERNPWVWAISFRRLP